MICQEEEAVLSDLILTDSIPFESGLSLMKGGDLRHTRFGNGQ